MRKNEHNKIYNVSGTVTLRVFHHSPHPPHSNPPWDTWQGLATFLVVASGWGGLLPASSGAAKLPTMHRTTLPQRHIRNVKSAEAEEALENSCVPASDRWFLKLSVLWSAKLFLRTWRTNIELPTFCLDRNI